MRTIDSGGLGTCPLSLILINMVFSSCVNCNIKVSCDSQHTDLLKCNIENTYSIVIFRYLLQERMHHNFCHHRSVIWIFFKTSTNNIKIRLKTIDFMIFFFQVTYSVMKSMKSCDQSPGRYNAGGGFRTI